MNHIAFTHLLFSVVIILREPDKFNIAPCEVGL